MHLLLSLTAISLQSETWSSIHITIIVDIVSRNIPMITIIIVDIFDIVTFIIIIFILMILIIVVIMVNIMVLVIAILIVLVINIITFALNVKNTLKTTNPAKMILYLFLIKQIQFSLYSVHSEISRNITQCDWKDRFLQIIKNTYKKLISSNYKKCL